MKARNSIFRVSLAGIEFNLLTRKTLLLFVAVLLSTCIKKDHFPDTPVIEFISLTKIQNDLGYDDKGILKISFTDGNGDIGLSQYDTFPPYNVGSEWYYNFFITYFEKQNGVLKMVELPLTNNSRIPQVNTDGSEKPVKGTIEVELFINNFASGYDTIAYEVSIADRALNISNKVLTPEIIIKKH